MTLTQREKALLYVLMLLVVGIGGIYLVILPKWTAYQESKLHLAAKIEEEKQAGALLEQEAEVEGQIKVLEKQMQAQAQPYFEVLEKESVDRWLHQVAQPTGVAIVSNQMSDPVVAAPERYQVETFLLDYPLKADYEQAVRQYGSGEPQEEVLSEREGVALVVMQVQLTVKGSDEQVLTFVDALAHQPKYVRTEQFALGGETKTLQLSLYMVAKEKEQQ